MKCGCSELCAIIHINPLTQSAVEGLLELVCHFRVRVIARGGHAKIDSKLILASLYEGNESSTGANFALRGSKSQSCASILIK